MEKITAPKENNKETMQKLIVAGCQEKPNGWYYHGRFIGRSSEAAWKYLTWPDPSLGYEAKEGRAKRKYHPKNRGN